MRFRLFSAPPTAPPPEPDADEEHPGDAPRAPHAGAAPQPVPPVVVPRWVQLVLLPIALLALWALARAAGPVLLILIVASVVALILNPLVALLERGHVPRGLAILFIYLGGFAALGGAGV